MKVGAVLTKERRRRSLTIDDVAARLGLSVADYVVLESGDSPIEKWGPLLGRIALELDTPVSGLLGGEAGSRGEVSCAMGSLIRTSRKRQRRSAADLASALSLPVDEYLAIEAGESEGERYGPLLRRFGDLVDRPVFDLLYPLGLPLHALDDYP